MEDYNVVEHYNDGNLVVKGQEFEGKYFLHVSVEKYTHNVQKKIERIFIQMIAAAQETGFPDVFYGIPEHPEFARYMGWESCGFAENGKEVFKWVNKI